MPDHCPLGAELKIKHRLTESEQNKHTHRRDCRSELKSPLEFGPFHEEIMPRFSAKTKIKSKFECEIHIYEKLQPEDLYDGENDTYYCISFVIHGKNAQRRARQFVRQLNEQ